MASPSRLVVLGLNHRTAPLQVREQFAIPAEALPDTAGLARAAGFGESFVLSTCNRVELYATTTDPVLDDEALADVLAKVGNARVHVVRPHVYSHQDGPAVRHLFRVASSLDSMVIGEPQILGQMRTSFEICRVAGLTGPSLNRAVERAFKVARKVRAQTGIGRHVVSISSVAVDLARQIFGKLESRTAALIGAGKMGELAARYLVQAGIETLWVANRSPERANAVATALGGHPRDLGELPRLLTEADIVVTSTGARDYLIDKASMKAALKARKYRPIFLIDIAVPRNVDPACNTLDNVFCYDVDDLTAVANENMVSRQREAEAAEGLVAEEAIRFLREMSSVDIKPTIIALRRHADAIKGAELERALRRLGELDPKQLKVVEMLADGVVNKLLHDVQVGLKQAAASGDDELLRAARALFALPEDDSSEDP